MPTYKAPLRDLRFVYNELFNPAELQNLPGFEEVTPDLVEAILEEAGKFCENVLLPINRSGDEIGVRFDNGQVITPPGLKEAYQAYSENGWGARWPSNYWIAPVVPHDARIVIFHGECNPPDALAGRRNRRFRFIRPTGWVAEHWRE